MRRTQLEQAGFSAGHRVFFLLLSKENGQYSFVHTLRGEMDDDDQPASKAGMMGSPSPTRCSSKSLLWWCHYACQSWLTDHDTREAKVENIQQADNSTIDIRHTLVKRRRPVAWLIATLFYGGDHCSAGWITLTCLSRDKSAGVKIPSPERWADKGGATSPEPYHETLSLILKRVSLPQGVPPGPSKLVV